MTIACTRCGSSEEGEIILSSIAFAFKHEKGCGHGIGPLTVLPSNKTKKSKKKKESKNLKEGQVPWENNDTPSNSDITGEAKTEAFGSFTESEGT